MTETAVLSDTQARLIRAVVPSFEASGVAVTLADPARPDCPLFYANAAFLALTGHPAEAVRGRNCRFLQGSFHEEQKAERARLSEAIATGMPAHAVLINETREGEPFVNSLFLAPLLGPDGQVLAILGSQFALARGTGLAAVEAQAARLRARAHLLERRPGHGTPGAIELQLRSQFEISRSARGRIQRILAR